MDNVEEEGDEGLKKKARHTIAGHKVSPVLEVWENDNLCERMIRCLPGNVAVLLSRVHSACRQVLSQHSDRSDRLWQDWCSRDFGVHNPTDTKWLGWSHLSPLLQHQMAHRCTSELQAHHILTEAPCGGKQPVFVWDQPIKGPVESGSSD